MVVKTAMTPALKKLPVRRSKGAAIADYTSCVNTIDIILQIPSPNQKEGERAPIRGSSTTFSLLSLLSIPTRT